MVDGLTEQVATYTVRNVKLEKAKDELTKKIQNLEEENRLLRQCILDPNSVSRDLFERLGLRGHLVSSVSSLDDKNDTSGIGLHRSYGSDEAIYRNIAQGDAGQPSPGLAFPNLTMPRQHIMQADTPLSQHQQQLPSSSFMNPNAVTSSSMYSPQALTAAGINPSLLPMGLLPPADMLGGGVVGGGGWQLSDADRQKMLLAHLFQAHQQQQQQPNGNPGGINGSRSND